ncbi:uncharacterized protein LOC142050742 isoform X1 [Phalacrocorax aristotelis]|uniref:uncharacterized protein LOC142050742 isoform X1 n=2 Tax=Phalacrocorax aristotelis TaxID=126867 RepID=UPI003F4B6FF8
MSRTKRQHDTHCCSAREREQLDMPGSPSPPQHVESMVTELEERCPICLGSCEEPGFVMPCFHRFCYPCILRWAEIKPECPLCKRTVTSVLHSVQEDDDYVEHVLTPPMTPSVAVRQAGRVPRPPAAHNLHHPGASQRWAAGGVPRRPVGGLQPPNWMNSFQNQPTLLNILQRWVHQEQEEIFGILTNHGMDTEGPGHMQGVSLQNRRATRVQQPARVAGQGRSRDTHPLRSWQDARAAGEREGSPTGAPGPAASQGGSLTPSPAPTSSPARTSADELPGTSPVATGEDPSSHPSAPVAIPVEQEEPQEEPGEAVPGPSTSSQGPERSRGGTRQPPKRKTGSSEASPAKKRPAPHQ